MPTLKQISRMFIVVFIFLISSSTAFKESFDEKLVVWPMPNRFNLIQF